MWAWSSAEGAKVWGGDLCWTVFSTQGGQAHTHQAGMAASFPLTLGSRRSLASCSQAILQHQLTLPQSCLLCPVPVPGPRCFGLQLQMLQEHLGAALPCCDSSNCKLSKCGFTGAVRWLKNC